MKLTHEPLVIEMKKQSPPKLPPKPKPVSDAAARQQLEKGLQNYTCQLPKDLSQRARDLGLERNQTVYSLTFEAVDQFIRHEREKQIREINKNSPRSSI